MPIKFSYRSATTEPKEHDRGDRAMMIVFVVLALVLIACGIGACVRPPATTGLCGYAVAAGAATSVPGGDAFVDAQHVHVVPSCHKGESCEQYRSVSDATKQANAAAVRDALRKADNPLVAIFAPWCPHCKRMLPSLDGFAKQMMPKMKVFVVNAELVTQDFLREHSVSHFPFVMHLKNGSSTVLNKAITHENLKELVST